MKRRTKTKPGHAVSLPYTYADDPECAKRAVTGKPCGCHYCLRAQYGEFYWLRAVTQ